MKLGTLITVEGIKLSLDTSELGDLIEYLCRQEVNEALFARRDDSADVQEFVGPEDYERAIQAAWAVHQARARSDAALTSSSRD